MTWTFGDDTGAFLAAAGASLAARPVEHTVALTVTERLRRAGPHHYGGGDPVFGWWRGADGTVAGTLVRTPPHPALLNAVPHGGGGSAGRRPGSGPGSGHRQRGPGHRGAAGRPAARLPDRAGAPAVPAGPAPAALPAPEGRARAATPADRALLVEWVRGFADATGQSKSSAEWLVDEGTERGALTLWESGGAPVALAGRSLMLAGTVRVTLVYTPPELRGRGYAAAVTHAAGRVARESGAAEVVLFADLANPTSNGVYLRIGYEPVADRLLLRRNP